MPLLRLGRRGGYLEGASGSDCNKNSIADSPFSRAADLPYEVERPIFLKMGGLVVNPAT